MIILYLLSTFSIHAQDSFITLNNKSYFMEGNKWYTTDPVTDEKFEVKENSMTVKLKNEKDRPDFEKLCKENGIIIDHENILGYCDLILPENSKFYEVFKKLDESGLFYSIEVTTYGKLLGSNDPGYPSQYYLENSIGYPDINIEAAWTITKGSPNVIIAVIDEGVDNANTDINANIWAGYGWDYVDNDSYPHPEDDEHHGTSVAGIIAAETNNNSAVAGIAGGWNGSGGCKIMSLRVFYNQAGIEKPEKIDDAIIFAANNGAKIINMSFALDRNSNDLTPEIKTAVDAALNYAYKEKGCLLIAASGNETKPGIYYPARNPNVMAIGGILKNWQNYGKYGSELELVAPANGIYSLLTSTTQNQDNWGLFDYLESPSGTGTSASSPQAAGVAALIFSKYPNWINYDVRKILNESAYDLGDQLKFGNGLLQADVALQQANPSYQTANNRPQNVTLTGSYGSHPTINWPKVNTDYIDRYHIYRAHKIDNNYYHFQKVAEVVNYGQSSFSWTDNSVIIKNPRQATSTHYYRVTSVNYEEIESVTSNEVRTGSNWTNKYATDNQKKTIIYEYSLSNNYPNPFNPSTIIKYSIKENGLVSLKVKDMLGRTVKTLVNKWQPKVTMKLNLIPKIKFQAEFIFTHFRLMVLQLQKNLLLQSNGGNNENIYCDLLSNIKHYGATNQNSRNRICRFFCRAG